MPRLAATNDDELWERADRLYQEFRETPRAWDPSRFDRLCDGHPDLASILRKIRRQDADLRRTAELEGASSGSLEVETKATSAPTVVDGPRKRAPSEAVQIVDRITERTTSFGKYHLARKIGQGTYGTVYRVWDEDLNRALALKLLKEDFLEGRGSGGERERQEARSRFIREAQLTAQLDHPNIVPLHDFGITKSGRPYFTMKFVKGRTLKEVIALRDDRTGPWTLTRILGVFLQACDAVAYAHDKGVIHRDLKPSNVMVGRFGAVYVVDWGVVKKIDHSETTSFNPRTVPVIFPEARDVDGAKVNAPDGEAGGPVGTPVYMPPEQARGANSSAGRRSDTYALGAILYHILAGAPPYQAAGRTLTGREVMTALVTRPPESIDEVAPDAPYELRRVVEKAMSREPEDRYRTVADLSAEVVRFIEGKVVRGWRHRPIRTALRWARHNPMPAALFAMSVLLIGVVVQRVVGGTPDELQRIVDSYRDADDATRADIRAAVEAATRGADEGNGND